MAANALRQLWRDKVSWFVNDFEFVYVGQSIHVLYNMDDESTWVIPAISVIVVWWRLMASAMKTQTYFATKMHLNMLLAKCQRLCSDLDALKWGSASPEAGFPASYFICRCVVIVKDSPYGVERINMKLIALLPNFISECDRCQSEQRLKSDTWLVVVGWSYIVIKSARNFFCW